MGNDKATTRGLWITVLLCLFLAGALLWTALYLHRCSRVPQAAQSKLDRRQRRRVLVLRNWNNQGGFFYQVYNLFNAMYLCDQLDMALVVLWDTGLYLETRPGMIKQSEARYGLQFPPDTGNWFHNYFEPINETPLSWAVLRAALLTDAPTVILLPSPSEEPSFPPTLEVQDSVTGEAYALYGFDRRTLQSIVWPHGTDRELVFGGYWSGRRLRLNPDMERGFRGVCRQLAGRDDVDDTSVGRHVLTIGVHYRGLDKNPGKTSHEDGPIHFPYEFVVELLRRECQRARDRRQRHRRHGGERDERRIVVVAASDERAFVEHVLAQRGHMGADSVYVLPDVARSDAQTSGWLVDTSHCELGVAEDEVCREYNRLIEQSIHRGMRDVCNYRKGREVLLEAVLLTHCNVAFLQSRGNVSNFVRYILRSRDVQIVDMVSAYLQEHNAPPQAR